MEHARAFSLFFQDRDAASSKVDFLRNRESVVALLNMVTVHRLLGSADKVGGAEA